MEDQVKAALDEIRPRLQADGGDVEFVSLDGDVVKVRMTGACKGCPMAQMTLQQGIERLVKQRVPAVTRVENVP